MPFRGQILLGIFWCWKYLFSASCFMSQSANTPEASAWCIGYVCVMVWASRVRAMKYYVAWGTGIDDIRVFDVQDSFLWQALWEFFSFFHMILCYALVSGCNALPIRTRKLARPLFRVSLQYSIIVRAPGTAVQWLKPCTCILHHTTWYNSEREYNDRSVFDINIKRPYISSQRVQYTRYLVY